MCVEGGVGPSQVARDLGVNVNTIRAWVKAATLGGTNDCEAMQSDCSEIARLRRELREVKMERDILRRRQPTLRERTHEVQLHQGSSRRVSGGRDVPCPQCVQERLLCVVWSTDPTAGGREGGAGGGDPDGLRSESIHLWESSHPRAFSEEWKTRGQEQSGATHGKNGPQSPNQTKVPSNDELGAC